MIIGKTTGRATGIISGKASGRMTNSSEKALLSCSSGRKRRAQDGKSFPHEEAKRLPELVISEEIISDKSRKKGAGEM